MNFGSMSTCHEGSPACAPAGSAISSTAKSPRHLGPARRAPPSVLQITDPGLLLEHIMITFLEGTLVEALPTQVVVAVHGIGYQVLIPLSSFDKLPAPGAQIKILTHLQVREDAHVLFGFMSPAERDLFRLLVNNVSGIGPKTALDVLSGISVTNFKAAVVNGDAGLLSKTKGIGKKTAERIIVELKDKVGIAAAWEAASAAHAPSPEERQVNDAVLALIALGYKQVDAHKAVKQAQEKGGPVQTTEDLVRQALKLLI
jgi:Holliday junction DNA helicase RuvA